ncbi:MAG: PorT family protein [Cyclobacteriaceae bacterium]|nr:PorT family protein [Cyclobacteriaceae bacterium]
MKSNPLVSLLLVTMTSVFCFGQADIPKREIGIIAGFSATTYSGVGGSTLANHVSIGIYGRFKLAERFSIDPRILFPYGTGARGLNLPAPAVYSGLGLKTDDVERRTTSISIEAPVSYYITNRFSVNVGPQFMVTTGSKDFYKSSTGNDVLIVDSKYLMHQFDAGVTMGIAFRRRLTLGLQYYTGLMYVVKDDAFPAKNSILQIRAEIPLRKLSSQKTDTE